MWENDDREVKMRRTKCTIVQGQERGPASRRQLDEPLGREDRCGVRVHQRVRQRGGSVVSGRRSLQGVGAWTGTRWSEGAWGFRARELSLDAPAPRG